MSGGGRFSPYLHHAVVEGVDDGALGSMVGPSPAGQVVWDRAGMLRFAVLDIEADVAAGRRNGGNEEE
ncbi:hypothetical protein STRTUCAR8_03639 [Streptomyces turgidiscabies Car8]|uniref:Uncharacterized protein n=1 Tax=Streptomyces turgidiscabies (strain Car8) TaxID=698760 RepID=L7ER45_STRT8|nr:MULTISPECIES: hypothetical protein [Streptomyces]ELP61497.1 hypothetical protein STRTUCAR8_03639 [Streptomyces turgidiscabies Car8]GAQ68608.1 hypothetical protein T45_00319 [Streptomyces turgidiscabies]